MSETSRQKELAGVSQRIFELAKTHDLPLTPKVYDVLFAYLTQDNPPLKDSVETALSGPDTLREDNLNTAHTTFLGNAIVEEGLERLRGLMARELAEVSDRISQGMRGNAQMIKTLQSSLRDLAGSITRESVQAVARDISTSGKSQLHDTTQLSEKLNRTQFQLNRMQKDLAELREKASTDHLTRLANRRLMDERMKQFIDGGHEFSFAMIDIDRFKQVNDSFGHAVGDTVLQGLGQFLRDNLKGRDFAARCGGEEFAIFLPQTGLDGARTLCDNIRKGFRKINWVNQQTQQQIGAVSLSIGVTERRPDDGAEDLLLRVDKLLYEAKENGRDRVIAG